MFNFIASALMVYLMVNVLIQPGSMSPESREFAPAGQLPFIHEMLAWIGVEMTPSPLNLSVIWAAVCCVLVRSEEHTSELQSLMRISYAVFCLKKKNKTQQQQRNRAP